MWTLFSSLPLVGPLLTFAGDHRYAVLAIGLLGLAAWLRTAVPVAGPVLARGCLYAAVGLLCFDGGYSLRARDDRTAALRAEVAALAENLDKNQKIAAGATARLEAAQTERENDHALLADYEARLAAAGDCALSDADARRLRQLAHAGAQTASAAATGKLRNPRAAAAARALKGAKAALAEHAAALAEANRRLRDDRAFYADVLKNFSAGGK